MERINVRARAFSSYLTCAFHRFDASRYEWLAEQLRDAGRPEAARLADGFAEEHRQTAEKLGDAA